jgi:hypothetical protein
MLAARGLRLGQRLRRGASFARRRTLDVHQPRVALDSQSSPALTRGYRLKPLRGMHQCSTTLRRRICLDDSGASFRELLHLLRVIMSGTESYQPKPTTRPALNSREWGSKKMCKTKMAYAWGSRIA